MQTSVKLSAYGAALAVLVAGTYTLGTVVAPAAEPVPTTTATSGHGDAHGGEAHGTDAHDISTAPDLPGGLASSRAGYTFVPDDPTLRSGTFAFRITGPDGAPVTAFDVAHDKRLHLIVVRRDTTGFQHLHPEMDADGTWRVPLSVGGGGAYRAFADFAPTGGPETVLGLDLFAAGEFTPVAYQQSRTSTVDDLTVVLDGDLTPDTTSPLRFTITRGGTPVTVQPYLGAAGHLVALREGDLAYLHVHPTGDAATDAPVSFSAEVPTAGTYRLFLDFQVDGVVRTADFTVATAGGAS